MTLDQQSLRNTPVYLNPAYTDFTPGSTELKFNSLNPHSKFIVVLLMLSLMAASCVAVVAAGVTLMSFQQERALETDGIAVQGQIDGCRQMTSSRTRNISVSYHYDVQGQRYTQSATLPDDFCTPYQEGARIDLRVVKGNPATARLAGESSDTIPGVIMTLVSLGFAIFLTWTLRSYFLDRSRFSTLRADGQVLDGELISIEEKVRRSKYSRRPYLVVHYRLMSPTGTPLEGKMQAFDRDLVARRSLFSPGTPVKVLYANDGAFVML